MKSKDMNPEDDQWMGRHAGDADYQWKLNASSDHIDEDEDNETDEDDDASDSDWGHVDPLDDGGTSDTDPSGPGSAV